MLAAAAAALLAAAEAVRLAAAEAALLAAAEAVLLAAADAAPLAVTDATLLAAAGADLLAAAEADLPAADEATLFAAIEGDLLARDRPDELLDNDGCDLLENDEWDLTLAVGEGLLLDVVDPFNIPLSEAPALPPEGRPVCSLMEAAVPELDVGGLAAAPGPGAGGLTLWGASAFVALVAGVGLGLEPPGVKAFIELAGTGAKAGSETVWEAVGAGEAPPVTWVAGVEDLSAAAPAAGV